MYGSQEKAEVLLDNDGTVYFKPTCVDTTSSRTYTVRNLSRLPINFEWKIKRSDSMILSVQPTSGSIQPNEIQVVLDSNYFNLCLQR